MKLRILMGLFSLLTASFTCAQIYKYIDEAGRTVYSDIDPSKSGKTIQKKHEVLAKPKTTEPILTANLTKLVALHDASKKRLNENLIRDSGFSSRSDWLMNSNYQYAHDLTDNKNMVLKIASFKPDTKQPNSVEAGQCIAIENASSMSMAVRFYSDMVPAERSAHEIQLIWYQDENCTIGREFGEWIRPKMQAGWQDVELPFIRPALGAKFVKIKLMQRPKYSWYTPAQNTDWMSRLRNSVGMDVETLKPRPITAYWDDIQLFVKTREKETTKPSTGNPLYDLPGNQNYVINGGFDINLDGWLLTHEARWRALNGHGGVLVTQTQSSVKDKSFASSSIYQCINIGTAISLDFSAKAKVSENSSSEGGGRVSYLWFEKPDCTGRIKSARNPSHLKNSQGWQTLESKALIRPENSQSFRVGLHHSASTPGELTVFWDDIRVTAKLYTQKNAKVFDSQPSHQEISVHTNLMELSEEEFFALNRKQKGVIERSSGLQYRILKSGPISEKVYKSKIKVLSTGKFLNGEVFDGSGLRGQAITAPIAGFFPGMHEALALMNKGDKWVLYIPPRLAFGSKKTGGIPPNTIVVYDVELLDIIE